MNLFETINPPFVVTDRVEELHGLHHSVHLFVLGQNQVVAGQRDAEDDGSHALEAVDPLLAFGPEKKNYSNCLDSESWTRLMSR